MSFAFWGQTIFILAKNPAKQRYVSLLIKILVWGEAKSLSWVVKKYCVGVGCAMTKYQVGVGKGSSDSDSERKQRDNWHGLGSQKEEVSHSKASI